MAKGESSVVECAVGSGNGNAVGAQIVALDVLGVAVTL